MIQWSREFGFEHTFLISMYRSSGISGARPVSCLSVSRDQAEASRQTSRYGPRHQEWDILGLENYCACSLGGMVHSVPADLRIRRILLPARATCLASCLVQLVFFSSMLDWRLTGHNLDLGNSVRVTEDDTNLGGSRALLYTRTQSESIPPRIDKTFRRTLERRTMDSSTDSAEVLSHDGKVRE